ncbi:hypothetical protein KAT95_00875 [Candidatus Parcubacteria bacterium]|nr:hypothetical protein [Candidatus Parcubacteria bacterium]
MNKIDRLRKKYPRFVYESYSYKIFKNDLKIFFDFKISHYEDRPRSIFFKPEIIIRNIDKKRLNQIGDKVLDNLVFHLGLMEIPSYWKATCSPIIEIKAGYLNKDQIKWWKDFILNGMGQFFYENQIDFTKPDFIKICCLSEINKNQSKLTIVNLLEDKILIPMGEGKDSIITLELLKKFEKSGRDIKNQINCFIVNPKKGHFKILKIAGAKNPVIVRRKVDLVLSKLYQKGFLNGHTPITALISNLAVFAAVLFGYKNIAMSCERSADEGNIKYLGKTINHQWSKTFEFENKFRNYLKKYLVKDINYFSFLRPLYEIQIAKLFSEFHEYFPVFLSCNEARKTNSWTKKPTGKWCGKCSKCLFVFLILYPFIKEEKVVEIFNKNLFQDQKLIPLMKELVGETKFKPFECIGTKKECLIAFYLALRSFKQRRVNKKLPVVLDYFEKKILPKYSKLKLENDSKKILNSWNKQNSLPKKFDKILLKGYYK